MDVQQEEENSTLDGAYESASVTDRQKNTAGHSKYF